MKTVVLFLLMLPLVLVAQESAADKIKLKLARGNEPLPGASLRVKGSTPPQTTTTDIDGNAVLTVPKEFSKIEITFTGPYVLLEIIRPVDSISFDIESRKATYYFDGKKMKTRKQVVKGY
jgi:hypothetical protein